MTEVADAADAADAAAESDVRSYPGACPPDRLRAVDAYGVTISVKEWGDADAPPLLLAHGGFDFARTYDVFAPLLAAGGWRVVSWDQRGHGDSDQPGLYSWEADVRDAACVLNATTSQPVPFVGHSKGGALQLRLAAGWPHRVSRIVNIDGIPSGWSQPDVAEHERTRLLLDEIAGWLDHRARTATRSRRPGTIAELARRRQLMNPRMSLDWLEYLVTVGGRCDADGWRWKLDPSMRFGGFGPWRPEWSLRTLPAVHVPMLGFLASNLDEPMGWGTTTERLGPWLPENFEVRIPEACGHFIHIEQPQETADAILEFLAR